MNETRTIAVDDPIICLFVCHAGGLCRDSWMDRHSVWGEDYWEPKNIVLDGGSPWCGGRGLMQPLPKYFSKSLAWRQMSWGCFFRESFLLYIYPPSVELCVLDAPWCEIRPTHDSFKHVRTTFPSRKKEKFEDKLLVKSRNEPSCIMYVVTVTLWLFSLVVCRQT